MSKVLPAGLQTHLDSGTTTLCFCWRVTRPDATVQGFTNHDVDLVFEGTTFLAASGFTASEVVKNLGLSIDNLSVAGALSSSSLNDTDLAAGKYDNSTIEIFRVNWANVSQRVLIHKGPIGEIKRGKTAFEAELLGLAQQLNTEQGRRFNFSCDAVLGDARCKIDLNNVLFKGTGSVTTVVDPRRLIVSGIDSFATLWFSLGRLLWTSGPNSGNAVMVKRHVKTVSQVTVELWEPMSETIVAGNGFTITAGCDKQSRTCKSKFNNLVNHRGFEYMIGNDAIMAAAAVSQKLDGSSRYGN